MSPEGAPDYFALAGLVVKAHAIGQVDEDHGVASVNLDTLADAIASRLEAMSLALRAVLADVPLPDAVLEKCVAALVTAERAP